MGNAFNAKTQEHKEQRLASRPSGNRPRSASGNDAQQNDTNSQWPRSDGRGVLALFVVALVLFALITSLYPAVHMRHAVIQEAMLAVVALVLTGKAVGLGRLFVEGKSQRAAIAAVLALLLAAAAIGGSASFFVSVPSMEYVFEPLAVRVALMLALCLLTGVFEECLFRGLAFSAFRGAFSKNAAYAAAIAQAALFAFMHVSLYEALLLGDAIVWAQVAAKAMQAFLFGVVMAALAVRTRGLWLPIVIHALFDCLYLGPGMVMSGVSNAQHFSGMLPDLATMLATVVVLAFAFRACASWLCQ